MLFLNNKLKNLLNTILLLFLSSSFLGQIPSYYQSINLNLTGDQLKNELSNLIINTHQNLIPYTSSSLDTWDVIKSSDVFSLDSSKVMLVYGYNDNDAIVENDRTRDKALSCHSASCFGLWNREHVFPKSLASPNLVTNFPGPGTDVHNLRACDYSTNSSRSNKKYNDGSGNSGSTNQGDWYPGDEWKGDVARIVMYMYLRYPNQCEPISVGEGTQMYSPNGDIPDLFLDWNQEDPVTNFEELRNEAIYIAQGNRNPFIDNPYLATLIWNGPNAENKWTSNTIGENKEEKSISVVYNKLENEISILNLKVQDLVSIELFNVKGQISYSFNSLKFRLPILNAGIYLVKVQYGKSVFVEKISIN